MRRLGSPRWLRSSSPCRPQCRLTASLRMNCVNRALCVCTCVCTVCIFVSVCVCALRSCKCARVCACVRGHVCACGLKPDCAGMALPPCHSTDQTSENNKTTSNMIISPMKAQQKLFIPFVFLNRLTRYLLTSWTFACDGASDWIKITLEAEHRWRTSTVSCLLRLWRCVCMCVRACACVCLCACVWCTV